MRVKGTSNVFLKNEFEVKSLMKVRRRILRSKFFERHTYATAHAKVEIFFNPRIRRSCDDFGIVLNDFRSSTDLATQIRGRFAGSIRWAKISKLPYFNLNMRHLTGRRT